MVLKIILHFSRTEVDRVESFPSVQIFRTSHNARFDEEVENEEFEK